MKEKTHLMFFEIMNDARDAQIVKGAQQSLLYHLILRCDPKKDYSCFPSFELLCTDTGLDMTTVKRAARELEKKSIISRLVRPNRSNIFYINVKLLQEASAFKRASRAEDKASKEGTPFEPPILWQVTEEALAADDNDSIDARRDGLAADTADEELLQQIHTLLKDRLGSHPTYQDPNANNIMRACVVECVTQAGSAKRCKAILQAGLEIEENLEYLSKSRLLGGCLKKCFPGWVVDYDERQLGECAEHLLQFCWRDERATEPTNTVYGDAFQLYLHKVLGHDLIRLDIEEVGKGVRFMVEMTEAAKFAQILGSHTGYIVDISSVPKSVDSATVTQLKWAVANEPWATAFSESSDPLAYFIDHLDQIAEEADGSQYETGLDEVEEDE